MKIPRPAEPTRAHISTNSHHCPKWSAPLILSQPQSALTLLQIQRKKKSYHFKRLQEHWTVHFKWVNFVVFEKYLNKAVQKKRRLQGKVWWLLHLLIHSFKTITPLNCSFKPFGYITFFIAIIYSQPLSHRWLRGPYNSCSPNSGHLDPTEQILCTGKDSSEYQLNFYFQLGI